MPQGGDRDQQDEQDLDLSFQLRWADIYLEQAKLERVRDGLRTELADLQRDHRALADELREKRTLLKTVQQERARQARLEARRKTRAAKLVAHPKALADLPRHARNKSLDLLADEVLDAVHVVRRALDWMPHHQVAPASALLPQIQATLDALRTVFGTAGGKGLRKSQSVLTQLYFYEEPRKKRRRRRKPTRTRGGR